jgi:transposase
VSYTDSKGDTAKLNYVGIDVHKSYCQVAILDTGSGVLDELRIASAREAFSEARDLFGAECKVAVEASSHWGWVVDHLQEMGMEVVLSHPSKTKAIGSAKIKTDKIDARMLAHLLAADLLPEAHISTPQVRELRSYLRYRYALVQVRTQAKNRIHAILSSYGLKPPGKSAFTKDGLKWLREVKLRELHRSQVEGYLGLIDYLSAQIASIDKCIEPMAEQNKEAQLLMSLSGIGYYSALLIVAEVDGVERFANAKKLVSYAGLCPSTRSSGGKERHGRITRTGSRYLRWILVEAAQKAAYPWSPYGRFYWPVARKKGSGTARVAVARKLLESIYHMLKTGESFDIKAWSPGCGVASAEA